MLEILSLDNKPRWNEIVQSMDNYDFYHLAEYHQLDLSGTPLLLYYSDNTVSFALPVILRAIAETGYKDITSVYGYAGPLSGGKTFSLDSINKFQERLRDFFDSNRVISAFARLHPLFLNQASILNGLGNVRDENQTVGINLTLPEEEQKKQYTHSLKQALNHLKRKKVFVRQAETKEEIDTFIAIYRENMERVNAAENYFFSCEYFHSFLHTINSFILLAFFEREIICGSLCSMCNGIIQTHLAATKNEFLRDSPLKYVWDQVRETGVKKQMKYLHFGGGISGKNDSLFFFKSHFSNLRFMFKTWRYIHNKTIYNDLLNRKFNGNIPDNRFFPLYRLVGD
jgi:hypothetical protein